MSTNAVRSIDATSVAKVDMKIEVVVIPVSDVDPREGVLHEARVEARRHASRSEIFHIGTEGRASGPDPEHRSYFSRATFSDPDGNSWMLQEITTRLPGRVDPGATSFGSASDLASVLRRAAAAHDNHEKSIGGDETADVSDCEVIVSTECLRLRVGTI